MGFGQSGQINEWSGTIVYLNTESLSFFPFTIFDINTFE